MSWLTESKDYTERMNRAYGKLDESKIKEAVEDEAWKHAASYYADFYYYTKDPKYKWLDDTQIAKLVLKDLKKEGYTEEDISKDGNALKIVENFIIECWGEIRDQEPEEDDWFDESRMKELLGDKAHDLYDLIKSEMKYNQDLRDDVESAVDFEEMNDALVMYLDHIDQYDNYDGDDRYRAAHWLLKDFNKGINESKKLTEKNDLNLFNDIRTSYYGLYRTLCDKYGEEAVAQMIINHMNCTTKELENALYEIGQEKGIFVNYDDFEDKFMFFEESKMREASVPETFSKSDEIVTHTIRARQEVDKAVTAARELEDELVGLYNDGKIHEGFDPDANIKESKLKESEDGWNEDVLENCGDVLDRIYDLTYEIKNCIKGAYTGCETYEELADYIRGLADDLRDAADGVAYCCDDEDEDL